jgi:hypothetical protein
MQNYFDVVQDQHGNAIPGASVFVYDASGLPATLFSDNGVTPTANPLTTNTDGEYDFFAANGRYSLDIQIAGYAPQNKTGIILFDPAEPSAPDDITYIYPAVGAVTQTVQERLEQYVSVKDFGAVGDGVTDDTAALAAAFNYAIPLGISVELEGDYTISGPIQDYAFRASGGLHIVCKGNVTITVNSGASGFTDVLYFDTTAINSASITGGMLTIDGANKAGRGITIRHNGATGGKVNISAKLKIVNILETDAAATRENEALAVVGRYETVVIDQPYVKNVDRTNFAGATKGIAVSGVDGICTINQPYVENVLCVSSAGVDADGIAVFGYASGTANNARNGTCIVNEPVFVNCQGRGFKGQISDVAIYHPRVKRTGAVVAIANAADFDFQFSGDVLLHEPVYEYYETGGVSPFSVAGSSFNSVVFQQTLDNREMSGRSIGGTIYTNVQWSRYCALIPLATAKRSVCEVSGLKIVPVGAFASSAVIRAVLEIDMGVVAAKTEKTRIIVRNVEGPFSNIRAIGYTGYSSGSLASKLSWEVTGCHSTLAGTLSRPFDTLSGTAVGEAESFLIRNNYRFRDLLSAASTVFSFAKLVPGCKFTVDLASVGSVVNPPAWGTNGYAYIEVLEQWFAETDVVARVTINEGDKQSMRFFTRNGGAAWASESIPSDSAANIASIASVVNTRNKLTGLQIYDTTNNRVMIASGSAANSPWYVVDGSASVTPA